MHVVRAACSSQLNHMDYLESEIEVTSRHLVGTLLNYFGLPLINFVLKLLLGLYQGVIEFTNLSTNQH